ncbi:MAG: diguanylate cyclase domain-containing protein, partial [Gammaproteobacteria bacterium]
LMQMLDLCPLGMVLIDATGSRQQIVYVNRAFETLTGHGADELRGQGIAELAAEPAEVERLNNSSGSTVSRLGFRCNDSEGAKLTLELEIRPIFNGPGRPSFWLGLEQRVATVDAEEFDEDGDSLQEVLHDATARLRQLDGCDRSTGILTRRAFDELAHRDWVIARREQQSLAMIVFRLDAFADYEDVFGRHAAESCLRKVAHAITGSLRRAGDLAARYSDDQFVALVGNIDEASAASLAQRVADKVRELSIHHPRSPASRFVTVSYGAAVEVPPWTESTSYLADKAEEQLPARVSGELASVG